METIKWAVNKMPKTADANLKVMGLDEIQSSTIWRRASDWARST